MFNFRGNCRICKEMWMAVEHNSTQCWLKLLFFFGLKSCYCFLYDMWSKMLCQTVPDYAAVPGWFVAPADCEEIETDLEIGGKKIQRMMVTQASVPKNGPWEIPWEISWHDIVKWYEMIWNDMKWCEMIWNASLIRLHQTLKALLLKSCELPAAGSSDLQHAITRIAMEHQVAPSLSVVLSSFRPFSSFAKIIFSYKFKVKLVTNRKPNMPRETEFPRLMSFPLNWSCHDGKARYILDCICSIYVLSMMKSCAVLYHVIRYYQTTWDNGTWKHGRVNDKSMNKPMSDDMFASGGWQASAHCDVSVPQRSSSRLLASKLATQVGRVH